MRSTTPIPCCHPEVIPVRKWNHQRLEFIYRCTTCHQVVDATPEAA